MNKKPKILIVEDEVLIAEDIYFVLIDEGHEIVNKAYDVEEAITMIEADKPEIILLDISLDDDGDGIELAHEINKKYQIPFIFISSHSDKLTINQVNETKPYGFIVKPFNPDEIIITVAIAFHRYKNTTSPSSICDEDINIKGEVGNVLVKCVDILYLKEESGNTLIVTESEEIKTSINIETLSENIPKDKFVIVNDSYMLNINKVTQVSQRFIYINEIEIPLKKGDFKMLYKFVQNLS